MSRYPIPNHRRPQGSPEGRAYYDGPSSRRRGGHDDGYSSDSHDDYIRSANASESEGRYSRAPPPRSRERNRPQQRITTIDWRAELCRILEFSTDVSDGEILDHLEASLQELKDARLHYGSQGTVGPPRAEILYTVHCARSSRPSSTLYRELHSSGETAQDGLHLLGRVAVTNLELHLERNKDIAFIVYKDFECCGGPEPEMKDHEGDNDDLNMYSQLLKDESIAFVSGAMTDVLSMLGNRAWKESQHPQFIASIHKTKNKKVDDVSDNDPDKTTYPYLWWFHSRQDVKEAMEHINREYVPYLSAFKDYVEERMSGEWKRVDRLMSRNKITAKYLRYLYPPGEVIVSNPDRSPHLELRGFEVSDTIRARGSTETEIKVWSWAFDGNFQLSITDLPIFALPSETEAFDIKSLEFYPKRFARPGIVDTLRARGRFFWRCRYRNYVSSKTNGDSDVHSSAESSRYMIDMETYKRMHPTQASQYRDDLGKENMEQDEPPLGDKFYMCLPVHIIGFNMQNKEWVKLEVQHLEDVRWNKKAFEYLVINKETKELIRAVVSNQLSVKSKTDLIEGKGSGLFMLLHGGPGTGKTLTAESVAEIAQRPLYRVTCGDIGTKAEEVEKYLASVLLLGTTWKCVVLLDEADVFLEQRSLLNLERNALVSVFLRVLEYYNGILILTSNRVGTFDEAFKSRIQLSLHYKNLDQHQRREIWKNFIGHLDEFQQTLEAGLTEPERHTKVGYGIDVDDLNKNLEELSRPALNGRDIRNALSTARQLALYRQQPLQYNHLQVVMGEVQKFDDYLREVHNGYSEDDIQRARESR
ncbi:unnamed protein product [Clonostachys chloroleuca]|uniref:AAA+ ATPase domain-containing protein n=1 Tax=Clonostachys chloroleuca TaxID=1926264 RepID=A0AA35LRC0_9HYPO|nr:unnamed protein product [Clonostachys chloroleuca]